MAYYGIFAAANPRNDLASLRVEFQNLQDLFVEKIKTVIPIINYNATENGIFAAILYTASIRIFHFSGHAHEGEILLDNGNLSDASTLKELVRNAKNPDLIFLNGCGTDSLVKQFLMGGARVVIATNAPVFDSVATKFSSTFYAKLCDDLSIEVAFNEAKRLLLTKDNEGNIPNLADIDINPSLDQEQRDRYKKMMEDLKLTDKPRGIRRNTPVDDSSTFHWAIYVNEDDPRSAEYVKWKLSENVEPREIQHPTLGLDFITSFYADDHNVLNNPFQYSSLQSGGTLELQRRLKSSMLLPFKTPFDTYINTCTDSINRETEEQLIRLLECQLDLYRIFIRTSAAIMLSDFAETLIGIDYSNDERQLYLRRIFKQAITENGLFTKQLKCIAGQSVEDFQKIGLPFKDLEFCINFIRGVFTCLAKARSVVDAEGRKIFSQFVEEYNGDTASLAFDVAKSHLTLLQINKFFINRVVEKISLDGLRIYCDMAESALIELFNAHRYLLTYKIIAVGKVEAIRQRHVLKKIIEHALITSDGASNDSNTEYGNPIAENYCSLLIAERYAGFQSYLSLSPFIINVASLMEDEKTLFFYFDGKNGDQIEFTDISNKRDPRFGIHCTVDISKDSFLTRNSTVSERIKSREKDGPFQLRTRVRFRRVRDLYNSLEASIKRVLDADI